MSDEKLEKEINGSSEFKLIVESEKILQSLVGFKTSDEKLWVWQNNKLIPKGQTRCVHFGVIKEIDIKNKLCSLKLHKGQVFNFEDDKDLYLYSEDNTFAFKVFVENVQGTKLIFSFPSKILEVEGDVFEQIQLVELEEEEKWRDFRAVPRHKIEKKQLVIIKREVKPGRFQSQAYPLYDISASGIGLLCDEPGLFKTNEIVRISSIGGKGYNPPMEGKVVNIKQMPKENDASKVEFKIGVLFETEE